MDLATRDEARGEVFAGENEVGKKAAILSRWRVYHDFHSFRGIVCLMSLQMGSHVLFWAGRAIIFFLSDE